MTEDEYRAAVDALLRPYGGSFARPSGGWATGDKLYFSCTIPPVEVPLPQYLSETERRAVIALLTERLGDGPKE